MIKHLTGIHETVAYRPDTQICLYNNDEAEDYPPHWHTPFEIIMPTENSYRVLCGQQEYQIRESDILIIAPRAGASDFKAHTGDPDHAGILSSDPRTGTPPDAGDPR